MILVMKIISNLCHRNKGLIFLKEKNFLMERRFLLMEGRLD